MRAWAPLCDPMRSAELKNSAEGCRESVFDTPHCSSAVGIKDEQCQKEKIEYVSFPHPTSSPSSRA
eukprot:1073663-Amphidinium_carterae.1